MRPSLCLLPLFLAGCASAQELVVNPGFEEANKGWVRADGGYTFDTQVLHSGK